MAHTDLIAGILAFWMGYSANQASPCLVAAALELHLRRRPRLFVGLLIASAAAGLVSVPLAWSRTVGWTLAGSTSINLALLLGAVAFGFGALINDACLLGSLSRLGDGELRLMAMPFGLATGLLLIDQIMVDRSLPWVSILTEPSIIGATTLVGFLIIAVVCLRYVSRKPAAQLHGRWPLGVSMLILGISGGALYALAPAWTYVDLVQSGLMLTTAATGQTVVLTVSASIVGAATAALRQGRWRLQLPTPFGVMKSFIGGALMGVGVALIPGGNNRLILAAIPALSPGGTAAYLLIAVTIVLGLSARDRASGRRATDPI